MLVALFVVISLLVVAQVADLYVLTHPTPTPDVPSVLAQRERLQWVITLKSGSAFRGVLVDHDAGCLVLANAEHLADPQSPVPVDGQVVILLGEVKYAQRL